MAERPPVYGLLAGFADAAILARACRAARAEGYISLDAFAPYPDEDVIHALGARRSRLPWLVFAGGLAGGVGGYLMQWYGMAVDYPLNVAGKPLHSWPMFVPVTFELTILAASLTAVLGMLALNGLPRPHHPLFNVPNFDRATRDGFFLVLEARDRKFERAATRDFLASLGPATLEEVPW